MSPRQGRAGGPGTALVPSWPSMPDGIRITGGPILKRRLSGVPPDCSASLQRGQVAEQLLQEAASTNTGDFSLGMAPGPGTAGAGATA